MTRRVAAATGIAVVVPLAPGAVSSLLGTGPAYRTQAEQVADGPAYNLSAQGDGDLTERRFECSFLPVENGSPKPYRRGPFGPKESFAHSPFDETDTFRTLAPENATSGDAVFVRFDGTRYRVAVSSEE